MLSPPLSISLSLFLLLRQLHTVSGRNMAFFEALTSFCPDYANSVGLRFARENASFQPVFTVQSGLKFPTMDSGWRPGGTRIARLQEDLFIPSSRLLVRSTTV